MASVLKVDKLDPQSGTALEIGSSGDTITIPSGATFTQSGTMNASAITAGTVATARLGSGTASSSTFLRGDQTYAAPGGVALTGSTDNTVVTVTGADAIQGETTMTYDGTTLALTTSGGGLKLDGLASSNVNTLDDYEEGTWTPSLGGNTSYHTQTGTYTKIGRSVTIQGHLYINTIGTGSTTSITGLPFAATQPQPGSVNIAKWANLSQSVVDLTGVITGAGGTQVNATGMTAAAATNTENLAVIQGTTIMFFSATYFTT